MNLDVGSLTIQIGQLKVVAKQIRIPPAMWFMVVIGLVFTACLILKEHAVATLITEIFK